MRESPCPDRLSAPAPNYPLVCRRVHRPRITQAAERPRILPARRADRLGPLPRDVGRAMPRLHASDNAQLFEAWNVLFIHTLDMDQFIPALARPILLLRIFDRI